MQAWILPTVFMTLVGGLYGSFIKIAQNNYDADSILPFCLFINAIMIVALNTFKKVPFQIEKYAIGAGLTFSLTIYYFNKAISEIANPGIPVAVSRTQIILTYFASLLLFHQKFSIKRFGSLMVIILGAFITIMGQFSQVKSYNWLKDALFASFWSSVNDIFSKYSLNKVSNNIFLNNEIISATILLGIIQIVKTKQLGLKKLKKETNKSSFELFNKVPVIPIIILMLSQFFMLYYTGAAFKLASNPAYPRAVFMAGQVVITTITSLLLEKNAEINIKESIGMLLIIIGAVGTVVMK
jgi:drug/metabolite transporter (DMT)-like permease